METIKNSQKFKVKKKTIKHKKKLKDAALSSKTFHKMKQSSLATNSSGQHSHKSKLQGKNSFSKSQPSSSQELSSKLVHKSLPLQNAPKLSNSNIAKEVINSNGSSDILNNHHSDHKQKRKRGSKKAHDGVSNWASLCSKLKINPTRKSKSPKDEEPKNEEVKSSELTSISKQDIWFDNVDKFLIEGEVSGEANPASEERQGTADGRLVKPDSYKGVTQCVAMDCEMVGVGHTGEESILARVSIVNHFGVCLYDKFVLPREEVTDYRTHVSGVTRENLKTGEEFTKVQKEVSDIIRGKVLIGHALHNDLKVLFLTHPHKMIRDTSKYKPFRQLFKGGNPSLKKLADKVLGVSVQEGQHSSVQDAQATMRLYTMYRQQWEKELKQIWKQDKKKLKKKAKKKQLQAKS
ncbi:RNA exonuclease 4 [Elysia marginata]|uniref:RNA exonuclease 4 n=1 Tax=Elysia marginata TaxID=1093978 RepID=A0AAV4HH29_9GAST|nr:RNA exonuclease 4 [Elysia marginata]